MGGVTGRNCWAWATVALFLLALPLSSAQDPKVSELKDLEKASNDGIVRMDLNAFNRYAGGKRRSYSLVIFLTAGHLLDKENLNLRTIRKEFGYLVKAYHSKVDANSPKVFFAEIEFNESKEVFHRLGVNTLPYILRLAPSTNVEADGTIKLPEGDVMKTSDYTSYPWTANDMASFLKERMGVDLGTIERPSFKNHPLAPLAGLAVLAAIAIVGYQLVVAEFTKNVVLWCIGAVVVYTFSVSGAMHNIIRGVPMYYFDPNAGKMVLFMPGGQGQLGAEGFIMGGLYTTFGLSLAALSVLCPKVPDYKQRRVLAYLAVGIALYSFYKIVDVYTWKTGYHWRSYLRL